MKPKNAFQFESRSKKTPRYVFRTDFEVYSGFLRSNRSQKRVHTTFLHNPMCFQLFGSSNSQKVLGVLKIISSSARSADVQKHWCLSSSSNFFTLVEALYVETDLKNESARVFYTIPCLLNFVFKEIIKKFSVK